MRNAVAAEEVAQAHDVGRRRRTDQHRAAGAGLDQPHAPQDQRAHDPLAEIGFGNQQRTQPVVRDQQRFDFADRTAVDERAAAAQLTDLAGELADTVLDDRRVMAVAITAGDADGTGQHDEHAGPGLAGFEQPLTVRIAPHRAEAPHALDLRGRQRRKRLRAPRFDRVDAC